MKRPDLDQIARAGEGLTPEVYDYLRGQISPDMRQRFAEMQDRADREQRLRHIEWAILLLGGIAIGLLVGGMIGYAVTSAMGAIADPLAGMPW